MDARTIVLLCLLGFAGITFLLSAFSRDFEQRHPWWNRLSNVALYAAMIVIITLNPRGEPRPTIREIGFGIAVISGLAEGFGWLGRAHIGWKRRLLFYSVVFGAGAV